MTVKATWLPGDGVWTVRNAQFEWGCYLSADAAREGLARWGLEITQWTVRLRADPYEEAMLDPTDPTNLRGL